MTDEPSILELVIDERRKEPFAEGLPMHDFHRFGLPLVSEPGTPHPDKAGTYGSTTCLPLPEVERFNDPTLRGA